MNALCSHSTSIVRTLMALTLTLSLHACGDDNNSNVDAGGTGGSAGQAGTGGSAGQAGTGGNGGTAGIDVGEPIQCGAVTCNPTTISPACCTAAGTGEPGHMLEFAGRAPNQCGTDLGQYAAEIAGLCLQLRQPGTLDSQCPAIPSVTPGAPANPGCCTDEGFCGGYEGFLPLGCTYPASGRGQACGQDIDAGTNDAGE